MRLLVIDGNAPWVRSFFAAMPTDVTVDYFRVYSALDYKRKNIGPLADVSRWRQTNKQTREFTVLVPGWTRAYTVSSAVVQTAIRVNRSTPEPASALVFTSPYYADAAQAFPALPRYYLAHDVFRFYQWNTEQVIRLERRMLSACDASLVVARALAEDFRKITRQPVEYSPMAATAGFVDRLATERGPMPDDLAALPRPIIGCVGQINYSYDWVLIAAIADAMPDVTLVFVGPMFPEPADVQRRIDAVFSKSNVRYLGVKPHSELPSYLNGFDVCLNPLSVNEHNDRRSPLRLFDYLATDRPILSTAIREANEHVPFVEIGHSARDCVKLLQRMLAPTYRTDLTGRAQYIRNNTWKTRAEQLLRLIAQRQTLK